MTPAGIEPATFRFVAEHLKRRGLLPQLLTSARDRNEWPTLRPGRFTSGENTLHRNWTVPSSTYGRFEEEIIFMSLSGV